MVEEKKQPKFKVGDRVIGVAGLRGTVTRLGQGEHVVFILWDYGNSQELTWVSGLTKLNKDEPYGGKVND